MLSTIKNLYLQEKHYNIGLENNTKVKRSNDLKSFDLLLLSNQLKL